MVSFATGAGKPRGKPNGGSGADGGSVILEASARVASLIGLQRHPHWKAEAGGHGSGQARQGKRGEDLVLKVPLGTLVKESDGTLLADLVRPGQRVVVAIGGRGGKGNLALASTRRRAPGYAEQGEYGEEVRLVLELKLMADAALVGFPNAGKSTLISKVSAAHPKIADYPFTTLEPHLGVVWLDGREFVLADIPGLVEGAAEGKGLGHRFLSHIERARVLVLLVDPSPLQLVSPAEQYRVLVDELARFSPELAARPRLLVLGKADLPQVNQTRPELDWLAETEGVRYWVVSSLTGEGLNPLLHAIADQVETLGREVPDREGYILHRPARLGFTVERSGEGWRVLGRAAERAVALDDLTRPEAALAVAQRLASTGVTDALAEAGAQAGDDVEIGGIVFSYQPDEERETF